MDLRPFSWINPCGYAGLATIDLQTLGIATTLAQVQQELVQELQTILAPRSSPMYIVPARTPAEPAVSPI